MNLYALIGIYVEIICNSKKNVTIFLELSN